MTIIFLCGSLEFGRDGVGDYIRRLSTELTKAGHTVAAAALYDRYVDNTTSELQPSSNNSIAMLRIPTAISNKIRFKALSVWAKAINANWVSLQYVGYSFSNYGLPWPMLLLRKNIGKINLHVMLHELWCGMPEESGKKERLSGWVQKKFLRLLIRIINPKSVSTSNHFYSSQLLQIHISANVVPIFGNIPTGDCGNDDEWNYLVASGTLASVINSPADWLILGFFGSIYPCPGLDDLLQFSVQAASAQGLKLGLIAFGRNGGQDIRTITKGIPGATCWTLGMLPVGLINRSFLLIHAGVITTPANRLDKSGTVAALLERHIPVLVSPKDKTYDRTAMEPLGIFQANNKEDVLRSIVAKGNATIAGRLSEVVKFYAELALL